MPAMRRNQPGPAGDLSWADVLQLERRALDCRDLERQMTVQQQEELRCCVAVMKQNFAFGQVFLPGTGRKKIERIVGEAEKQFAVGDYLPDILVWHGVIRPEEPNTDKRDQLHGTRCGRVLSDGQNLKGTVMPKSTRFLAFAAAAIAACVACDSELIAQNAAFTSTQVADFDDPWALTFLPDGRLLVTEKAGALKIVNVDDGTMAEVAGVPEVAYAGQGGFGDVVLHPEFADNSLIYLSYSEPPGQAAVARARLALDGVGGKLENLEVLWRQSEEIPGRGHFGQRIAFGDGYLWISSGDRQQGSPAQDMRENLGKIVRLHHDGSVPGDNPFAEEGGVTAEIWSLGHRNPLGLAFDASGQLWNVEMGPQGGDELNRVERGSNYGWPIVSNGVNYGGGHIPDHDTRPEFAPPAVYWVPSILPSSRMFYDGDAFPEWRGDAFIGGLSSQSIRRIEFDADGGAHEAEHFEMGMRIRGLAQGPDGAIWALEGGSRGGNGRLFKLTPN